MNLALRFNTVEVNDNTSFGKDGPKYDDHVLLCTGIHHFGASADSAGRNGLRHDDEQTELSQISSLYPIL